MTTTKAASAGADGYWTIQIVDRNERDRTGNGRRYVCHAWDDGHAQSIAGRLAGPDIGVVGYDYHRINNPHGRYARALAIGQSEAIEDPDVWAVLKAARRSA
jgi:hypothetical protein